MTCCVGALADDAKAVILVADREVSLDWIAAEPEIKKIEPVSPRWWVMFSGVVSSCVDIIDDTKRRIATLPNGDGSVREVADCLSAAYFQRRDAEAEALHLRPHGWTLEEFKTIGAQQIPDQSYTQMEYAFASHSLRSSLILAGFDDSDSGHLLSVGDRGLDWHDKPGFCSIGSGSYGAVFMMYYREYGSNIKLREALYYAYEGKYFGEFAPAVGLDTDLVILRANSDPIWLDPDFDEAVNRKHQILRVAENLAPRGLGKWHRGLLNSIKELNDIGCEPIEEPKLTKREKAKAVAASENDGDAE